MRGSTYTICREAASEWLYGPWLGYAILRAPLLQGGGAAHDRGRARRLDHRGRQHHGRVQPPDLVDLHELQSEKDAKLVQKWAQLQPLIAVFPHESIFIHGPTCIFWANLTPFSLKCAIKKLGEVMARELAPHGVRVNVVQPGHMYTANEQAGMAGWTQAARDAYLAAAAVERHAADAANAAATVRRSRGSLAAACSRLHRSVHCRPPYEVARGESVSKC